MANLTKGTKQKLNDLLLINDDLAGQDHLIATLAVVALTYNNDLTVTDYMALHNTSLLSAAYYYDLDKFSRNYDFFKDDGVPASVLCATFDFVKEREQTQNEVEWIFGLAEELTAKLEENDNVEVLKAIKAFIDAQNAMATAIKARKEKRAIAQAEKDIETHGVTASALGLPALTGSVKQIAWAEKIREKCLEIYSEEKIGRAAKTATTAKYWIDNYKKVLN